MLKKLMCLAISFTIVGGITACGSNEKGADSTTGTNGDGKTAMIKIWWIPVRKK